MFNSWRPWDYPLVWLVCVFFSSVMLWYVCTGSIISTLPIHCLRKQPCNAFFCERGCKSGASSEGVFCGCQMVLPVLREECKAGKHCVALESNDAPVDTHLWVLLRGACRQDEGQAHQRWGATVTHGLPVFKLPLLHHARPHWLSSSPNAYNLLIPIFTHTPRHTHPLTADPTDITDFYIYAYLQLNQTEALQGDALCELPLFLQDRASL